MQEMLSNYNVRQEIRVDSIRMCPRKLSQLQQYQFRKMMGQLKQRRQSQPFQIQYVTINSNQLTQQLKRMIRNREDQ